MVVKFQTFLDNNMESFLLFALQVVLAIVVFVIGQKVIKWIRSLVKKSLDKSAADAGVVQFIDSLLKATLQVLLVVGIAMNFGLEPASVAALLASAGVAVGLALQGSLSNLAGGVLILLLKPFVVGDYIIEDTNKNEGVVTEIEIFYTKLKTVDNKVIVVPNGTLANNSITNITGQEFRRLDIIVGIAYEANLKLAKDVLSKIIEGTEAVLKDRDVMVVVDELGDSSVNIACKMWVKTEDYWVTRWAMLEEIKLSFDENDIEIPYNKMEVQINEQIVKNV